MTSEAERQRKQKELDSILDAALDELDEESDSDSEEHVDDHACYDDEQNSGVVGDGDDATTVAEQNDDAPTTGVPYSLEYLANNSQREERGSNAARSSKRPQFGPEPPPHPLPPLPPFDLPPGDAEELAASLEGMMKQFTEELGMGAGGLNGADFGGMPDLGNEALDDMFKKMMGAELAASDGGGDGGGAKTPRSSRSQSQNDPKNSSRSNTNTSSQSSATASAKKPKSSTPRKSNGTNNNITKEPNVDESINRLLDGINQASNDPLPNNMPPGMEDIDPTQFEQMGEEMMHNIMGQFEKMGNANDSNDVVDGVMKQLLDKDLMYEPMKEVCVRFPKWLAQNKEDLSEAEYQRYGTQYQYFQKIVRVYETEPDNFARLMELMQDIQEYGQPPVDIIKDLAPELEFDAEGMPVMDMGGMPRMPGMPGMPFPGGAGNEQCCIS